MISGAPSWMTVPGLEWWDSALSLVYRYHLLLQVGMIARDEADIGVASFYATAARAEAVDFSVVLKEAEYWDSPEIISFTILFRTKFFIKFPGRNLGGYLAFIKGPLHLTPIRRLSTLFRLQREFVGVLCCFPSDCPGLPLDLCQNTEILWPRGNL